VTALELAQRRTAGTEARLAAARELVTRSEETERYFDWTANHAPTAIERVHAGEIAIEWALTVERDRSTVRELEAELRALQAAITEAA
jgi:hypothetical protein